jgi:hypothetical protein
VVVETCAARATSRMVTARAPVLIRTFLTVSGRRTPLDIRNCRGNRYRSDEDQ